MNTEPPVALALDQIGVSYTLFRHPGPVASLEQAAAERGQLPGQVVRSILFRLSADDFIMVLVAGSTLIDWHALREYLGLTRISLASRDEVLSRTGYELGAVAPFGLPEPMRILLDSSVLAQTEISLGSGVRGTAIMMRSFDLAAALGDVEIVDVLKGR